MVGDVGRGDDVARRARDDDLGVRDRRAEFGLGTHPVPGRELLRPTGRRKHSDVARPTRLECNDRRCGIAAGADEKHAGIRPIGNAGVGHIEGDARERATRRSEVALSAGLA